jgi:hypothetical protein
MAVVEKIKNGETLGELFIKSQMTINPVTRGVYIDIFSNRLTRIETALK